VYNLLQCAQKHLRSERTSGYKIITVQHTILKVKNEDNGTRMAGPKGTLKHTRET
jgi:hypothetical protein